MAFNVVYERTWEALQQLILDAPLARSYFSDGFACILMSLPGSVYTCMPDNSQTFSVATDNAALRHYLERAVALFVHAWNRRQTFKRRYSKLPAHVCDFIDDF